MSAWWMLALWMRSPCSRSFPGLSRDAPPLMHPLLPEKDREAVVIRARHFVCPAQHHNASYALEVELFVVQFPIS